MKIFILALLVTSSAFAWETVYIPGARCGDGIPYKVFIKKGKESKLAIELMGGGACWSLATCWGPKFHTWIHPIPELPSYSYLTSESSPINDHTFLYFPYCNGDVFAGDHAANYDNLPFTNTLHHGSRNLKLALKYLQDKNRIPFKKADSLVLFGSSAGAIGSLIHRKEIESYVRPGIKKLLIADSPGLHFGPDFWQKFTQLQIRDFKKAFEGSGINVSTEDGMIAPQVRKYCGYASNWTIGFIQTTRDIIMSKMFGGLSQEEHRKAVLGPKGIMQTLKNSRNCSTHISEGQGHMLLIFRDIAEDFRDVNTGETSRDYVDRLIKESEI